MAKPRRGGLLSLRGDSSREPPCLQNSQSPRCRRQAGLGWLSHAETLSAGAGPVPPCGIRKPVFGFRQIPAPANFTANGQTSHCQGRLAEAATAPPSPPLPLRHHEREKRSEQSIICYLLSLIYYLAPKAPYGADSRDSRRRCRSAAGRSGQSRGGCGSARRRGPRPCTSTS